MPSKARIRAAIVALAVPAVILAGTPASGSDGQTTIKECRLAHEGGSSYLYASVVVQNNTPNTEYTYHVEITFTTLDGKTRLGQGTTSVYNVPAQQSGKNAASHPVVSDPSASASDVPAGDVACYADTTDEEGETVGERQQWPGEEKKKKKEGEGEGEGEKPGGVVPVPAHTVVSGDTLSEIAEQYCGNASRWTEIYNANRDTIEAAARDHGRPDSDHGHWIYPGTDLVISC